MDPDPGHSGVKGAGSPIWCRLRPLPDQVSGKEVQDVCQWYGSGLHMYEQVCVYMFTCACARAHT